MTASTQALPERLGKFLLATRCFGRATPFPHPLMQQVLAFLDAKATYAVVIQDLLSRNLIVKVGKRAFDLSRVGFDHSSSQKVEPAVWQAALEAMLKTVPAAIEQHDIDSLDLLSIHAAGLANLFYSRSPETYLFVMGLSVQYLMALGR